MNKIYTRVVVLVAAVSSILSVKAQTTDFFDTSEPEKSFQLGVRAGVNMANQTHSGQNLTSNIDSWGTGFDAGLVFDLNIKNFFTLQPGLFFDIRNNKYCHSLMQYNAEDSRIVLTSNEGKTRHTTLTMPVMASFRFNLSDNIRWHVDLGPYFQFGIGGYDKGELCKLGNEQTPTRYGIYDNGYYDIRNKFDWGLKIGTAVQVYDHYYLGIHYQGGFCKTYKMKEYGGHNKTWMFTLGYDF